MRNIFKISKIDEIKTYVRMTPKNAQFDTKIRKKNIDDGRTMGKYLHFC